MYNQIGLKTPRGSGTNGYVQRNLAFREKRKPHSFRDEEARKPPKVRVANPEILEHQRKRKVEVMLVEWAEKEEIFERYGQEEGEKMVAERRKILLEDLANGKLHFSGNKYALLSCPCHSSPPFSTSAARPCSSHQLSQ